MKKKTVVGIVLAVCCTVVVCGCGGAGNRGKKNVAKQYSEELFAMDTYMTFTAYGEQAKQAVKAAVTEVKRLDTLWSVSSEEGEIAKINETGQGEVSEDTLQVLEQAQQLYQDTDGAFDLTVYPLMDLWGFTSGNYQVPSKRSLKKTLALVGQNTVTVDSESGEIRLAQGQRLDLGAIAKGFTSNRVMELWKQEGVESGIISLGGNVQVIGKKVDGNLWNVGIQNPDKEQEGVLGVLGIEDQAVITSGGYERYFEQDGKTYHHILDPKTGYPAENGLVSVSVISEDGMLADGLSTALFVMGKDRAVDYWRQHKDRFDVVFVEEDGTISVTEGVEKNFQSDCKYQVLH